MVVKTRQRSLIQANSHSGESLAVPGQASGDKIPPRLQKNPTIYTGMSEFSKQGSR